MQIVGWAAIGWLIGLALESVARRVAGETEPACARCGRVEPGPACSALVRLVMATNLRCPNCRGWSLFWLASLGPLGAICFGLLAARWPAGGMLLAVSAYTALLLLVAALDLRHRLVYPVVTYPATALGMLATPAMLAQPIWAGALGAATGAAFFALLHLLARRMYRNPGALGFGDVMIAGMIGAMAGFPTVMSALAIGTLFGGFGAVLIGLTTRSRRAQFAYGPALCLGLLILLLAGPSA